jgi:hypothetical protein
MKFLKKFIITVFALCVLAVSAMADEPQKDGQKPPPPKPPQEVEKQEEAAAAAQRQQQQGRQRQPPRQTLTPLAKFETQKIRRAGGGVFNPPKARLNFF